MTPSASKRAPSAVDALGEAISHMRAKLFPFSFAGWITLGFVSLIESCGSSGAPGGPGGGNPFGAKTNPGSFGDPIAAMEQTFAWIAAHMVLLIGILFVGMLFSLVVMWLRSRMVFVYIDDVATGRFDLLRPWKEHGAHADSFFAVSLVVQGAVFILMILILGGGAFFVIWARTHDLAMSSLLLAMLPIGFLFFLSVLVAGLLGMVLRDFVAPLQISRNVGAREAGEIFWSMLLANPGLMLGYALLKFVVGIATGLVVALIGCLTCCIGFIPVISQTLFQPILFAERAWSLKLLAQMGDDVAGALMPAFAPSYQESGSDAPTGPIDLSQIDFEDPPQN